MADLSEINLITAPGELERETIEIYRQLRKVEKDYANLRVLHTHQTSAFRELNANNRETISDLRRSLDELSERFQDLVWQDEDQLERYGRRVGLLALKDRTLSELRAQKAALRRVRPMNSDGVLTRREIRRSGARLWRWERQRILRLVRESRLFSPNWYRRTYADCAALTDQEAIQHFVDVGLAEDRDPHALFSAQWVRQQGSFLEDQRAPLVAFLEGADVQPHPMFDTRYYLSLYEDVRVSGQNALLHYVKFGAAERRRPHLAFDPQWYGARCKTEEVVDLLSHYLSEPEGFTADPHPLFQAEHYLEQVPNLLERGIPPLLHYLISGWLKGMSPHPLFETAFYLDSNRDVAAANVHPFLHFLTDGGRERRQTHPLFNVWWYLENNPDVLEMGVNPLVHYVVQGSAEGRSPGPAFPMRAFWEAYPTFDAKLHEPIERLLFGREMRLEVPRRRRGDIDGSRPRSIESDGTFWLADRLREYVQERYSNDFVAQLRDLMRVVSEYGDHPVAFEASADLIDLAQRVSELASDVDDELLDVSIVIPVHNALVFTLTSVLSLLRLETQYRFEILIADDASSDLTETIFSSMGNRLRLVRQVVNVGFLENCNLAAAEARGRFLIFLNNDTILLPGWLDELIATFDRDSSVGYVGSKLLNADGTLQEAGGIVWRDGSGWNFGRGSNASLPEFNYVKDVDYCSGASIAIPMALWGDLGGFDPMYRPAYCEDSDLAFRVRAAGYRSVYQPFSELVHHEGRSHGRDETSGIKAYQVTNQQKFFVRWAETLKRENLPHGHNVLVARDRSRTRPHILIVDHYVPQWERDAGSRTMYHFVRAFLACGFQITFWPDNLHRDPIYTAPLQRMGVEVIFGPDYVDQFGTWFTARADLFDYALLSRPHIAIKYIEAVSASLKTRVLYYGHDLHWNRLMDQYAVTGNPDDLKQAELFREDEMRLARASAIVLYPSEAERDLVRQSVGSETVVAAVPAWIFDENDLAVGAKRVEASEVCDPFRLLFVGGFGHPPNSDGVSWFVSEVFPRLLEADARFNLAIVGSNAGSDILALAGNGVEIIGQVSDEELTRLYERAGSAIVPLRFGGGVKGKVIEAFAKGLPVISTSVGVQGIVDPERLVFLADKPETFAAAILHAAKDRAAAYAKASRALIYLRQRYSVTALARALAPSMPEFEPASDMAPNISSRLDGEVMAAVVAVPIVQAVAFRR